MDLQEKITLSADGITLTLPLVNFLRIVLVKLTPLLLEYQQTTGKSDIFGFYEWSREKLGMVGKNVLL